MVCPLVGVAVKVELCSWRNQVDHLMMFEFHPLKRDKGTGYAIPSNSHCLFFNYLFRNQFEVNFECLKIVLLKETHFL